MMNLIKIQKIENHKDIKNKLLSLISETPKKRWTNNEDRIDLGFDVSLTDWQVDGEFNYRKFYLENVNEYFEKYDFINSSKSLIHNVWFHQYYKNDYHNWHIHAGCQFASVYYLELPNSKFQTKFLNPMSKKLHGDIIIEEGDIIATPAFIPHTSIVQPTKERKTVIVFNSVFDDVDDRKIQELFN